MAGIIILLISLVSAVLAIFDFLKNNRRKGIGILAIGFMISFFLLYMNGDINLENEVSSETQIPTLEPSPTIDYSSSFTYDPEPTIEVSLAPSDEIINKSVKIDRINNNLVGMNFDDVLKDCAIIGNCPVIEISNEGVPVTIKDSNKENHEINFSVWICDATYKDTNNVRDEQYIVNKGCKLLVDPYLDTFYIKGDLGKYCIVIVKDGIIKWSVPWEITENNSPLTHYIPIN